MLKEVTFLPQISQIQGSNVLPDAAIFLPGELKDIRVLSLFEERKQRIHGKVHYTDLISRLDF